MAVASADLLRGAVTSVGAAFKDNQSDDSDDHAANQRAEIGLVIF